jgi:hypothetical protein
MSIGPRTFAKIMGRQHWLSDESCRLLSQSLLGEERTLTIVAPLTKGSPYGKKEWVGKNVYRQDMDQSICAADDEQFVQVNWTDEYTRYFDVHPGTDAKPAGWLGPRYVIVKLKRHAPHWEVWYGSDTYPHLVRPMTEERFRRIDDHYFKLIGRPEDELSGDPRVILAQALSMLREGKCDDLPLGYRLDDTVACWIKALSYKLEARQDHRYRAWSQIWYDHAGRDPEQFSDLATELDEIGRQLSLT